MPSRQAALYCDEDVSVVLAAMLRARGFPVPTARDTEHLGQTDEDQLQVSADAGRVLLTHNRVDFERLHRHWIESGRRHAGSSSPGVVCQVNWWSGLVDSSVDSPRTTSPTNSSTPDSNAAATVNALRR